MLQLLGLGTRDHVCFLVCLFISSFVALCHNPFPELSPLFSSALFYLGSLHSDPAMLCIPPQSILTMPDHACGPPSLHQDRGLNPGQNTTPSVSGTSGRGSMAIMWQLCNHAPPSHLVCRPPHWWPGAWEFQPSFFSILLHANAYLIALQWLCAYLLSFPTQTDCKCPSILFASHLSSPCGQLS